MARLGHAFALLAFATPTLAGPNQCAHKTPSTRRAHRSEPQEGPPQQPMSPQIRLLAHDSACAGYETASARWRATPRLEHRLIRTGAIVLAAAYYAYCVYGKSNTRQDKETEPLMPVATATPMT